MFVVGDRNDPAANIRGDVLLDVLEYLHLNEVPDSLPQAAIINTGEYMIPWKGFFSVGQVRLPECGELIDIAAWVGDPVKQRVVDCAYQAADKGPIVEIGRLFGGTAALLALGAREKDSDCNIFSFDPDPHIYNDRFLELYNVTDNVALVDIGSIEGALLWHAQGLPPVSLLHVDGDHRYESVKKDIDMWYPLLAPKATIMFDDFGYQAYKLAGTTRAIFEAIVSDTSRWEHVQVLGKSLTAVKR